MTTDRKIIDLLHSADRPLLSLEFFPPKTDEGMAKLRKTAERLLEAEPDFVTVTWGAGGSTRERTLEVCRLLHDIGYHPVMPHLTCVGASRTELEETADAIYDLGYRNIMTLRGDPPRGETTFTPPADGLRYAGELVKLLKGRHPDFCCGVAGYPEKHPECPSIEEDVLHLKAKLEAGADFATTQFFFQNEDYYRFLVQCREAGIREPILPGILPIVSLKQIRRFLDFCEASLPEALETKLEAAGGEGTAAQDAAIEWAAEQIDDLLAHGAPGIHLYVLNRSRATLAPALANCFAHYR